MFVFRRLETFGKVDVYGKSMKDEGCPDRVTDRFSHEFTYLQIVGI